MPSPIKHISAISLFVEDVPAAKAFYVDVFDVPVVYEGPLDRPWGMRTANFVDTAGHSWEIAQQTGLG